MCCREMKNTPEDRFWGSYEPHEYCSSRNIINGALCVFALLPSVLFTIETYSMCPKDDRLTSLTNGTTDHWSTVTKASCRLSLHYPIAMANILFFLNVSCGFWLIGLVQQNFWLIDPYWTLLPPLLAHYYGANPLATSNPTRSYVSMTLIWIWAARLTFSYFRREVPVMFKAHKNISCSVSQRGTSAPCPEPVRSIKKSHVLYLFSHYLLWLSGVEIWAARGLALHQDGAGLPQRLVVPLLFGCRDRPATYADRDLPPGLQRPP